LELEGEKGEWGFKALKQMIKINFKLVGATHVPGSVSTGHRFLRSGFLDVSPCRLTSRR